MFRQPADWINDLLESPRPSTPSSRTTVRSHSTFVLGRCSWWRWRSASSSTRAGTRPQSAERRSTCGKTRGSGRPGRRLRRRGRLHARRDGRDHGHGRGCAARRCGVHARLRGEATARRGRARHRPCHGRRDHLVRTSGRRVGAACSLPAANRGSRPACGFVAGLAARDGPGRSTSPVRDRAGGVACRRSSPSSRWHRRSARWRPEKKSRPWCRFCSAVGLPVTV